VRSLADRNASARSTSANTLTGAPATGTAGTVNTLGPSAPFNCVFARSRTAAAASARAVVSSAAFALARPRVPPRRLTALPRLRPPPVVVVLTARVAVRAIPSVFRASIARGARVSKNRFDPSAAIVFADRRRRRAPIARSRVAHRGLFGSPRGFTARRARALDARRVASRDGARRDRVAVVVRSNPRFRVSASPGGDATSLMARNGARVRRKR
jgi:hypothetical protein